MEFKTLPTVNGLPVATEGLLLSRSGKDGFGLFTVVEWRRPDGTLAIRSALSGGTAPAYTTRTITNYEADGVTVESTWVYSLSYDAEGDLVLEEVMV